MNRVQQLEAEVNRLERMIGRSAELGLRPSRSYQRQWKEALVELERARAAAGVTVSGDVNPTWFVEGVNR